jgi:hypothetical protein
MVHYITSKLYMRVIEHFGGIRIGKGNRRPRRKAAIMPLCHKSHMKSPATGHCGVMPANDCLACGTAVNKGQTNVRQVELDSLCNMELAVHTLSVV